MREFRIWKFPMDGLESFIDMPVEAKILHVEAQSGVPVIWAEVNPEWALEKRHFLVIPTGGVVPEGAYLGTTMDGPFVWHIYEVA